MIRRRVVYHIAGYYPFGGTVWHRYFKRELAKFATTWNVRSEASDLTWPAQTLNPTWTVTTTAKNWQVQTSYEPLLWDDIVLADASRSAGWRFSRSFRAIADFLWSGTVARYFWASWQYGLFVLFPVFLLLIFAAVAWGLAALAVSLVDASNAMRIVLQFAVGGVVFLGLLQWPGRRWRLQHSLDDWAFSWDYLYRRRPDIDARLDFFADKLVAQARQKQSDEIIVVGHSMGATLAIEVIMRALERDPDLGRHGPSIGLATVGSTIAKFTLHPAGEYLRRCGARIVQETSIAWADYHARADAISFYKFNPVTVTRFYGDRIETKPVFRHVRLHHMLSWKTYLRNRLNLMRMHCQFIMANERRSRYDYFMMICGPIPFARFAVTPDGPAELIAADGALIDPAAPAPVVSRSANNADVLANPAT